MQPSTSLKEGRDPMQPYTSLKENRDPMQPSTSLKEGTFETLCNPPHEFGLNMDYRHSTLELKRALENLCQRVSGKRRGKW
jgi:hypothetical protein